MKRVYLTILGLALGLASGQLAAATGTGCVTINSLNFNSGYVIQLVNNPASVNPDAALNILTAQVSNNTGATLPAGQPVTLSLNEPANPDNCAGAAVISPISLTVKKPLPPGPSVLLATDFSGSGQAAICNQFQTDIQNQFQNINSSNASAAVTQFLRRRFQVVLANACSQASTYISIFNQPPANNASPAQPLLPRDQSVVTDAQPLFVWTPASAGGTTGGIDYQLVLSLDDSGTPWKVIENQPTGQLFYKWQASDPSLPAGKLYWHVVTRNHATGALLGGQGGSGWGRQLSFVYRPSGQAGVCGYSLSDLDAYVRKNAGAQASLLDGLSLQQVLPSADAVAGPVGLDDPDVCALLGLAGGSAPGQVQFLNLSITRR